MNVKCPSCNLSGEYKDESKKVLQCKRCNLVFSLEETSLPDHGITARAWTVKGEKSLPVSLRVLRFRIKSGALKENDQISRDGKNWITASEQPHLRPSFKAAKRDKEAEKAGEIHDEVKATTDNSIRTSTNHLQGKKENKRNNVSIYLVSLTVVALIAAAALLFPSIRDLTGGGEDSRRLAAENMALREKLVDSGKKIIEIEKRITILNNEFKKVKTSEEEFLKAKMVLEDIKKSIDSNRIYLALSLAENLLYVKIGSKTVKKYVASTGKGWTRLKGTGEAYNFLTPRGKRIINGKERNPVWYKPDWAWHEKGLELPENISLEDRAVEGEMGKYRLKMGDGYAIHGTKSGEVNGAKETHGCIRLAKNDLRELYSMVKRGTEVYIY